MGTVTMDGDVLSVERTIAAPAEAIFGLLCDPSRHADFDGSGTVVEAKGPVERLRLGSTFGMAMKLGVPYSMVSTVVELEQDRRIAWQSKPPNVLARLVGGRIWRYELEPVGGGTRVRESWDLSEDHQRVLFRLSPLPAQTKRNMERTLARIAELVEH